LPLGGKASLLARGANSKRKKREEGGHSEGKGRGSGGPSRGESFLFQSCRGEWDEKNEGEVGEENILQGGGEWEKSLL